MKLRGLKQAGFSLIEMAMVVSVLGVMVGGALSMTTHKMEKTALDSTDDRLDKIQTAITKFYDKNGYLPCPASPTAAESSASFGVSTDCSSTVTSPSDTWEAGTSTDTIRGGIVPTRTLGISDNYMYDQWDNRIGYVVIKAMATTSAAYSAYTTALTTGVIQVTDAAGNQIPDASTLNVVTYALISYGKDRKGAFTHKMQTGNTPVVSCGTTTKDAENCDNNDAILVDSEVKDSSVAANFYYDKVRWATRRYEMGDSALATPSSPSSPAPSTLSATLNGISSGGHTTCAIKKLDSTMWCWGYDAYGQIGDGNWIGYRYAPVAVSGGKTWKRVGLGGNSDGNVCAIASDDTAWCWGLNTYGAVGDGTTTTRNVPKAVSGGGTWADIRGGAGYSCGIKTDGTAWCWGRNTSGQLGDGTNTNKTIPTAVSGGKTWKSISVDNNWSSTCAIASDDTLWCWGANGNGQLGLGNTTSQNTPQQVGAATYKMVFTSAGNTCAIKSDDTLWCWGYRYLNATGDGTVSSGNRTSPYQVSAGSWLTVAIGSNNTCGIKSDYTLWCWGDGGHGILSNYSMYGSGASAQLYTMVTPSGSNTYTEVAVGDGQVCAIEKTVGTAYCWGDNGYGQIAQPSGNPSGSGTPCAINSTATWGSNAPATTTTASGCGGTVVAMKSLIAGGATTCGITSTGQGYCWGYNGQGELGISGDTSNKLVPTAVTGGAIWAGIDAGDTTVCGIKKADKSAWCWGEGSLGNGAGWQAGTSVAKKVSGGASWSKVVGGTGAACGIKTDQTLWCWGASYGGVLGNNQTTGYENVPAQVVGGGTWTDVAMGTCGIKADKTLWCWGTVNGAAVPTLFDSGSWEKIAGGMWDVNWHVCGIKTGGAMYCWGDGYLAKLGDGNFAAHTATTPVAVIGGDTYVDLALSQDVSCGLTSAGTVKCWGGGYFGQLGNNATTNQSTPTAIIGTDVFTSITGGFRHVCGIKTDKSAKCWGASGDGTTGYGAIGDNTTVNKLTATTVLGGISWGP